MSSRTKFGRKASGNGQAGYILLTLMLLVTLLVLTLAAVLPKISQALYRDREEEMVHRGVQYSRAIRRYYKKFGRYPTRVEELENTNNIRFLRQRYKDPITGQDFKLLHFGEVKMTFGAGIAGGVAPGANAVGGLAGDKSSDQVGQVSEQGQPNQQPGSDASNSSASSSSSFGSQGKTNSGILSTSLGSSMGSSSSAFGSNNQTFGGGPIVGVVSTSTKTSIREYNKKNHYNDWQFIYDPSSDRGGLLNTPAQPSLQNPAGAQGLPGQAGQPNQGNPAGVPTLGPGIQTNPMNPMNPPSQPPEQQQP